MSTGVMGHRLFLDNLPHTAVALVLAAVALALSFGPIEWLLAYFCGAVVFGPVLERALPHVRGELAPPERHLVLPPSTNVGFSPPIWAGFAIVWFCFVVCMYLYPDEVVAVISNQHDALLVRFSDPANNGLIPTIAKSRLAFERDSGVMQHFIALALVVLCLMSTYFSYFFCIFFGEEVRKSISDLYFNNSKYNDSVKNYFSLLKFLFGIALVSALLFYGIVRDDSAGYEFDISFLFFFIICIVDFIFFFWFFPFFIVFTENYMRVVLSRKY